MSHPDVISTRPETASPDTDLLRARIAELERQLEEARTANAALAENEQRYRALVISAEATTRQVERLRAAGPATT